MSATARKNIASLRGGGEGSPKPPAPVFLVNRFKDNLPMAFDGFREGSGDEKTGKLVEITIIKAGVSLNGLDYLPSTLREAATLFEGVPIYAFKFGKTIGDEKKLSHLPEQAKTRRGNFGNQVGVIKESWWDEALQSIRGLVAIFDGDTRTKLKNAFDQKLIGRGVKEPAFGLSIDAAGLKEGAGVTKIVRPESVDIVKKAAADGAFDRLVASATETEELDMEAKEVTALIETALAGNNTNLLKLLKEQGDEEGNGDGGDALSGLRKMLEGASPEDQRTLATRVLAMFKEMGLTEASPEEKKREQMTEALRGLMAKHAKDPKALTEAVGQLVEASDEPEDARDQKLKLQDRQLREMAISRVLDTLTLKEGRTFVDIDDAIALADLTKVKVSEDYSEVAGLLEAMEALAEKKPHLLKPIEDQTKVTSKEGADEGAAATAHGKKPAPRGQEVILREDADDDDGPTVKGLEADLAAIDERLKNGTAIDADLVRRARIGSQLKRARSA
ncbi:hypothetical protein LCGC14_0273360 [marine sediment metagenome]